MEYNEGLGSIRTKKAPKKTIKAYKLMRLVDGKLYPLFIDSSVPTEIGVWYDADSTSLDSLRDKEAGFYYLMSNEGDVIRKQAKKPTKTEVEDVTKMGLRYMYVKQAESKQRRYGGYKQYYNVGINGSGVVSPTYAIRPGWHAGSLPTMRQIGKGSNKDKRDDSFVWTEVELSADVDYNPEAQRNPDKDIPDHIPEDGYYMKATNADKKKSQADLVGWYVAGAMKINRIISDKEARQIIDRFNAKHPGQKKVEYDYERESGKEFDAGKMMLEGISSVLSGLGMSVHHNSPYLLKRADGSFIDPETGERLGFDHRFMSSGEGHQVHGWGSYFSVKDLKKYADNGGGVTYKGVQLADIDRVFERKGMSFAIAVQYVMLRIRDGFTAKQAIQQTLQNLDKKDKNSRIDRVIKDLKSLDPSDFTVRHKGNHYNVEIPDNDGTNYIEEDKKLSKKVLNKVVKEFERRGWKYSNTNGGIYLDSSEGDDTLAINPLDNGRILYEKISSLNDFTPKKASELLHDAGFVGIHYFGNLDGECYVIFDENDAKIVGHDLFGVSGMKGVKFHGWPKDYKNDTDYRRMFVDNDKLRMEINSRFENRIYTVATAEEPIRTISVRNLEDSYLVDYLLKYNVGKIIESESRPNYDQDPYGRTVQRGSYKVYKFDFSDLFKERKEEQKQDDKGYTFGDESTISDDFPKIYIPQDKEHLESDYLKICDINPEYTINPAYKGEHHTMPVLFVRDYKHHSAVDAVDFRFMGHGYNFVIATVNKKHLTMQVKCDVLDIYKKYIVMLAKSINEKRIAKGLKPMEIPDEYKQFDKDRILKKKLQLQAQAAIAKLNLMQLKGVNGIDDDCIKRIENLHKASTTINKWIKQNKNGKFKIELPSFVEKKIENTIGRHVDVHKIDSKGIRHSIKNHGKKGRKVGKQDIPILDEYYMLIPYIMVAPDRIEKGSDDLSMESVKFIKKLSNGDLIVVEKESINDPDVFETINMWGKLSDVVNAKSPNIHVRNVLISTSDVAKIIKDAELSIIKDKKSGQPRLQGF